MAAFTPSGAWAQLVHRAGVRRTIQHLSLFMLTTTAGACGNNDSMLNGEAGVQLAIVDGEMLFELSISAYGCPHIEPATQVLVDGTSVETEVAAKALLCSSLSATGKLDVKGKEDVTITVDQGYDPVEWTTPRVILAPVLRQDTLVPGGPIELTTMSAFDDQIIFEIKGYYESGGMFESDNLDIMLTNDKSEDDFILRNGDAMRRQAIARLQMPRDAPPGKLRLVVTMRKEPSTTSCPFDSCWLDISEQVTLAAAAP